ncbi:MAG: sensor histidine kinase [Chitinophagaceae bacterium]
MKRYHIILYHLLYWLLYESVCFFFIYISRGERATFFDEDVLLNLGLLTLTALASFYGSYCLLFPRYLAKKQLKAFAIAGLVLLLISSFIPIACITAIVYWKISFLLEPSVFFILQAGFFVCALINGIAATALRGVLHWWQDIRVKEALEKKNLETELESLKSQLQPHFLFNTINNIDILIGIDPAKASLYLQQLARMLRFILYRGKQQMILLEEEIRFIQDYVALQQIRKTQTDWITLYAEGIRSDLFIPPLLFLPFIENACKYAVTSNNKEAAISIRIITENNKLVFTCSNFYNEKTAAEKNGSGLGLTLSKQRMQLMYPDRHHLEITRAKDTFTVQCTVEL